MRLLVSIACVSILSPPAWAEEPVSVEFFEKKVRPILAANCTSCHGAIKQKGGLRLDSKAAFAKGGDNGAAVVPGDAATSLLVKLVRYDDDIKMPPKGKLSDADIATLTAWVTGGAPWPEDGAAAGAGPAAGFDLRARARAQWSFQPVVRPPVPALPAAPAAYPNPIDRFLLAKLQDNKLSFAPPADKRVLLRRLYFDLTGLPPSAAEIEAFLKDESADAYETVVDRLLASPAYGERWARHWLDLARYAETYGHEFDFEIAEAWRYRDYVVRAFNADLPYDRFLTEQLAGDLLPTQRRDPKTGANESRLPPRVGGRGESLHSPVDSRQDYADRIDNQIDVFGKTVLGLTLGCARCHDHKFDPISAKDYYSLFSVLSSTRYSRTDVGDPAATIRLLDELKQLRAKAVTVAASVPVEKPTPEKDGWRAKAVAFERFDAGWRQRWDACGLAFRPAAGDGYPHSGREVRQLSGELRSPTFTIGHRYLAVRVAGREARARLILNGIQLIQDPIYGGLSKPINHGEEFRWLVFDLKMWQGQPAYIELLDEGPGYVAIREAWFAETPPPADPVEKATLPEAPVGDSAEPKAVAERIREIEARIPAPQRAVTCRDGTGHSERVFIRGNPKTLGVEAPRAFLEAFARPPFGGSGSGRLHLAEAVADPSNPLVARVMVNRLWKHHFAEGIVRSPDDFGRQGQPPTHPELLDWLAAEFVNPTTAAGWLEGKPQPWSLKHLHRLIVLSAAYRQSSHADAGSPAAMVDPLNKLLHHQNVRRLEAEAIRDAMLSVSGRLDRTMGGPGVMPFVTEHTVGRGKPPSGPLDGNGRRSLYLAVRRNFLNPMFQAFDFPTPFSSIGRRSVSNVPAQALVMLNNPFVLQQADLWAKRVLAGAEKNVEGRIRAMYEAAFGRPPSATELAASTEFVTAQTAEYGKPDNVKAWTDLAHVLFNAKEFIFVE
jgi:hypothetical protein